MNLLKTVAVLILLSASPLSAAEQHITDPDEAYVNYTPEGI
jgi:hypothetical protein